MSVAQLLQCLTKVIDLTESSVSNARWFGFGSFFLSTKHFSDVDLLVVCETQEDGILIYQMCRELWTEWPVDLLIMTQTEEADTSFIVRWGCIPLLGGIPHWRTSQGATSPDENC